MHMRTRALCDSRNARCPEHPEYDARTLYVPKPFLDKQTPGLRQWWELKRDYFDTVLFLKVGKLYEMYHMDAMVCVRELRLTMKMRVRLHLHLCHHILYPPLSSSVHAPAPVC